MNDLKTVLIRAYEASDYEQCEALVSNAWQFENNFKPKELADLAKCIYTKGSVINSNYRTVIEVNGKVVGFIFGLNAAARQPKKNLLFGLSIVWRLLRITGMPYKDKKKLLNAINTHEINRSKIINRGLSEIVLFVIDADHQGLGYGKELLSGFTSHCKNDGVKSLIVETNKLGGRKNLQGFENLEGFF
jgi:GNAT superfamily N-acetyltransferase